MFVAGHHKYKSSHEVIGRPIDPHFHLPLWLQANCAGNILWFYNFDHLGWCEDFIAASLRERKATEFGFRNKALSSRLPKWMLSAKNRPTLLKAIRKLREEAIEQACDSPHQSLRYVQ
jgi:hypothetical protein